jgi:hypothetical protein
LAVVGYGCDWNPPDTHEPKADRWESVTLYPCGCTAKKEEADFRQFVENTRPV